MLAFLYMALALAADPIVGQWSGGGDAFELKSDGSATYQGTTLLWMTQDGALVFASPDGSAMYYAYSVQGDALTLTDPVGQTVVFHRGAAATSAAGPTTAVVASTPTAAPTAPTSTPQGTSNGGLVGRWTDGTNTVTISADGTMQDKTGRVAWKQDGSNLILTGPGGSATVAFKLDGDRLTVTLQGQQAHLARADGAVGVWVGNESSIDPTIVMSYTQYLTLYPDGSVGWSKSELTGSRSEPSPGWERFTSGSSSGGVAGSAGTWSEQGGVLTIRYNNGKQIYGTIDGTGNRVVLRGSGVLDEGGNVTFERK